jgi:hypothetical protein
MPRSERKQNRRPELGARGHSRPARSGTSAGGTAYLAPNNVVSIDQAAIPVIRPTQTNQRETVVVYTEGGLTPSVLKEIQELKAAVRRIEAHRGMRSAQHGNVPVTCNQLAALGWSEQEIDETRSKFSGLEQEWNDPSMDGYDRL